MSKYRRAARIDANQPAIVDALRDIPGVSVQVGMDDLLIGFKGQNYWIELKDESTLSKKTGRVKESKIKPGQKALRETWKGQYDIVSSIDEILKIIGR